MEPLHILYEDPHLVICCKPVGVLSEDGQAGRCMPELLREHYRSLGQKNPYIATVHRLDKITGGVMVFSRRRAPERSPPPCRPMRSSRSTWPCCGVIRRSQPPR